MKKFFMTLCVCTPSVKPSLLTVKGIYTALFILILTTTASAQIELKDNNTAIPFHKWEVGVDLKPLFRSDEPYNVLVRWHFTERKAVRLGLGVADYSKTKDTFWIVERKLNTIQYDQFTRNNGKKMNWAIKLGYQYEFKQGKVSIYTASDFEWIRESIDFRTPFGFRGALIIPQEPVEPFAGYQSIIRIQSRKNTLSLIQSLGFRYTINNYLSCAFETAINGQYIWFFSNVDKDPYLDLYYTKFTLKGGSETKFSFKPLMGLFLNYHF